MFVAVGSKNPVKIEAVRLAFEQVFPKIKWEVEGISVPSGVSDQPLTADECVKGAKNRAKQALKLLRADYGVGLEGGLQQVGSHWFTTGWMVVVDEKSTGVGASISMEIPKLMMEKILKGKELGQVVDEVFSRENSKHKEGYFGNLTNGHIDRLQGYLDGVISALGPFLHPKLFKR